jgi:hypothetical protein
MQFLCLQLLCVQLLNARGVCSQQGTRQQRGGNRSRHPLLDAPSDQRVARTSVRGLPNAVVSFSESAMNDYNDTMPAGDSGSLQFET